jgi:hypothetical protein
MLEEWLAKELPEGATVGIDPWVVMLCNVLGISLIFFLFTALSDSVSVFVSLSIVLYLCGGLDDWRKRALLSASTLGR